MATGEEDQMVETENGQVLVLEKQHGRVLRAQFWPQHCKSVLDKLTKPHIILSATCCEQEIVGIIRQGEKPRG